MTALSVPGAKWEFKTPLLAFIVTRLIVFGAAYASNLLLPMIANNEARDTLSIWNRWDAVWYVGIAENGYHFTPGEKSSVAFFPLYPLLMGGLKPFLGSSLAAGLLISNACFLAALIVLYRLTYLNCNNRLVAQRTVFYIAAVPTAFFFSAIYTESLFLLLTISAVYCARKQQWAWAALCGALSAATRAWGILVWGLLFLEWLRGHSWSWERVQRDYRTLLIISLSPLGLMAYMLYLWATFGDPLAFWSAQAAWGFQNIGPVGVITRDIQRTLNGELPYFTFLNILAFGVVLVMAIPLWRRFGAGYGIYTAFSVLIPMSSRTESMIRYILVLFPVFMLCAVWGSHRWFDRLFKIISLPFLGLFTALFVKGVFIG